MKNVISLLIIAAVIAGGILYYTLRVEEGDPELAESETATTSEQAPAATQQTPVNGEFKGTISQLVESGGNSRCEFTHAVESITSQGVVYVSDGKLRADLTSSVPQINATIKTHTIRDGGWLYVWSDSLATGYKMKADVASATSAQQGSQQSLDYDQVLNFKCSEWVPNASMFAVPSTVTFTEERPAQ